MYSLKNTAKCTFVGSGFIEILDFQDKEFYTFENLKDFKFNLPAGKFKVVSGNFTEIPFSQRNFIKLPKRERFLKIPKTIKIVKRENPMKAVIYKSEGLIYVDPSIFELPQFCFDFLKYHELGHYYYSTESYCDLFAASKMLAKGYNPSQIYYGIELLCSDSVNTPEMDKRIDIIFNHTKNGTI